MAYLPKGALRRAVIEAYSKAQFRGANDALWVFRKAGPPTQGGSATGTFAATTGVITCTLNPTNFAVGDVVWMTGGTTMPTSFVDNVNYYVISTGFSAGTHFRLALTAGGTEITNGDGGSAGTGTFTFHTGYLANIAQPGDLLVDYTNKTLYINTGTSAIPVWTLFSLTSGAGAFTGTFDGVVGGATPSTADFTTIGAIRPGTGAFTTLTAVTPTWTGFDIHSNVNAVTAIGTQASDAYVIIKEYTTVTTAASTAVGVKLPAAIVGMHARVAYPSGTAASIKVWPDGSEQIDAGGAGINQVITKLKTVDFDCYVAGYWVSAARGAVTS